MSLDTATTPPATTPPATEAPATDQTDTIAGMIIGPIETDTTNPFARNTAKPPIPEDDRIYLELAKTYRTGIPSMIGLVPGADPKAIERYIRRAAAQQGISAIVKIHPDKVSFRGTAKRTYTRKGKA